MLREARALRPEQSGILTSTADTLLFFLFLSVLSESEPGLEGAGAASASIQPDLRPAALLRPHPDPDLPALPALGFPLGPAAELVRDMDASVRVSNSSKNSG